MNTQLSTKPLEMDNEAMKKFILNFERLNLDILQSQQSINETILTNFTSRLQREKSKFHCQTLSKYFEKKENKRAFKSQIIEKLVKKEIGSVKNEEEEEVESEFNRIYRNSLQEEMLQEENIEG